MLGGTHVLEVLVDARTWDARRVAALDELAASSVPDMRSWLIKLAVRTPGRRPRTHSCTAEDVELARQSALLDGQRAELDAFQQSAPFGHGLHFVSLSSNRPRDTAYEWDVAHQRDTVERRHDEPLAGLIEFGQAARGLVGKLIIATVMLHWTDKPSVRCFPVSPQNLAGVGLDLETVRISCSYEDAAVLVAQNGHPADRDRARGAVCGRADRERNVQGLRARQRACRVARDDELDLVRLRLESCSRELEPTSAYPPLLTVLKFPVVEKLSPAGTEAAAALAFRS